MRPPEILKVDYQQGAKYVVAAELHGGMGTVYKLFPVAAGSQVVAMKTIRGDSGVQAFDIECEAWLSVAHHPNVARPLAFGTWKSMPSVLIEWYPQSLGDIRFDVLSGPDIQRLIGETVGALHCANFEKRLIHQDIKPANVLIDKHGNTKLSDFGLARCLIPNPKDRIQMGVGGVPKATSRELSGTPYFMAPELWHGGTPSVQTDIFSLGVTFYNCITREHPYVEDEDGGHFSRDLRTRKLRDLLSPRGREGEQILKFLQDCLSLDTGERYRSYDEVLQANLWLHEREPDSIKHWTVDRSEIFASAAQFFHTKGEPAKAFKLVEDVLGKRPNDVVLIEELAKLYMATGRPTEADLHFGVAYRNLLSCNGVYEGRFLPRPAFAWARSRIEAGYYEDAAEVIREVLSWGHEHKDQRMNPHLIGAGLYPEIGWYFLYKGEYSRAVNELLAYASNYSINKLESIWAVEAAWLSGNIIAQADELAVKVLENQPDVSASSGEKEFSWARMVLREYANPLIGQRLWNSTQSYLFSETRILETEAGLPPGSMLQPKEIDKQRPFVLAMDQISTGGINNGLIRSISKI